MRISNRLLKCNTSVMEWDKLSNIIVQDKITNLKTGISKYYLEQNSGPEKILSTVRFNKLVEIIEYEPFKLCRSSKVSELSLIVYDLKKDCGMIENILKPSTNRYRVPIKKALSPAKSAVISSLNISRKSLGIPSLTMVPKIQKPIKIRRIIQNSLTKQRKLSLNVNIRPKIDLKSKY
ncbi:hypothetical protein SteCoe_29299 [Stentor coeruleus]|uniref:Uncharacterized protein n=1 Tax=Stentor coeruleus TaxID=5963 RepID=A0A1R2B687_9CILI|nr:hypothetical protein SteCoe_29299 [Stentor coeruleus]